MVLLGEFLHNFSQLRQTGSAPVTQTGIRSRLLSESREWKRYEQRKMGEKTSERNDITVIAKCEGWAKPSQKINVTIGLISRKVRPTRGTRK
jgi:hypothetical protein